MTSFFLFFYNLLGNCTYIKKKKLHINTLLPLQTKKSLITQPYHFNNLLYTYTTNIKQICFYKVIHHECSIKLQSHSPLNHSTSIIFFTHTPRIIILAIAGSFQSIAISYIPTSFNLVAHSSVKNSYGLGLRGLKN